MNHYHVWRGIEHPKDGYVRSLVRTGTFKTRSAANKWLRWKGRRNIFDLVLQCRDPYCKQWDTNRRHAGSAAS